jgi:hypothetical protein
VPLRCLPGWLPLHLHKPAWGKLFCWRVEQEPSLLPWLACEHWWVRVEPFAPTLTDPLSWLPGSANSQKHESEHLNQ